MKKALIITVIAVALAIGVASTITTGNVEVAIQTPWA